MLPATRALAWRLIPRLIRWKLSANQVTALSLVSGLAGHACFVQGTRPFWWWGAVGFFLANLLDECDGEVARRTGQASGFGSWFDVIAGCIVYTGFFFSLGWGLARAHSEGSWMVLGDLTALTVLVSYLVYLRREILLRGQAAWAHPDPPTRQPQGLFRQVQDWLRVDFAVVVLISAALGWMGWILWSGLIGALLLWIPADLWAVARKRQRMTVGQ